MKNEKKLCGFSFSINIANFEDFSWTKNLISNLFFLKSGSVSGEGEFSAGASDPGGSGGVGPPLESGIYIVKKFLKTFLIYWDPPWIKIVPWPLHMYVM